MIESPVTKLEIKNGPVSLHAIAPNSVLCCAGGPAGKEVFHVTPEMRIVRNGVDVTDDDAAMVECLVEFLRVVYHIEVRRTKME